MSWDPQGIRGVAIKMRKLVLINRGRWDRKEHTDPVDPRAVSRGSLVKRHAATLARERRGHHGSNSPGMKEAPSNPVGHCYKLNGVPPKDTFKS